MAEPLLRRGIFSILVTPPFYGRRRPAGAAENPRRTAANALHATASGASARADRRRLCRYLWQPRVAGLPAPLVVHVRSALRCARAQRRPRR